MLFSTSSLSLRPSSHGSIEPSNFAHSDWSGASKLRSISRVRLRLGQGRKKRRVKVLRARLDDEKQRLRCVLGNFVTEVVAPMFRGLSFRQLLALTNMLPPYHHTSGSEGVAVAPRNGAIYFVGFRSSDMTTSENSPNGRPSSGNRPSKPFPAQLS